MQGEPRVFISYSHDSDAHRSAVRGLADRLRQEGVVCEIDQYVNGSPPEGWPRWMLRSIEEATHVLVVCTETYKRRFEGKEEPGKGKGADWEGILVMQQLYESRSVNEKFIPVLLDEANEKFIPLPLKPYTHYVPSSRYDDLYRHLTAQPKVVPPSIGAKRILPPEEAAPNPACGPAMSDLDVARSLLLQARQSCGGKPSCFVTLLLDSEQERRAAWILEDQGWAKVEPDDRCVVRMDKMLEFGPTPPGQSTKGAAVRAAEALLITIRLQRRSGAAGAFEKADLEVSVQNDGFEPVQVRVLGCQWTAGGQQGPLQIVAAAELAGRSPLASGLTLLPPKAAAAGRIKVQRKDLDVAGLDGRRYMPVGDGPDPMRSDVLGRIHFQVEIEVTVPSGETTTRRQSTESNSAAQPSG